MNAVGRLLMQGLLLNTMQKNGKKLVNVGANAELGFLATIQIPSAMPVLLRAKTGKELTCLVSWALDI